jgi:hypothetical protein
MRMMFFCYSWKYPGNSVNNKSWRFFMRQKNSSVDQCCFYFYFQLVFIYIFFSQRRRLLFISCKKKNEWILFLDCFQLSSVYNIGFRNILCNLCQINDKISSAKKSQNVRWNKFIIYNYNRRSSSTLKSIWSKLFFYFSIY